MFIINWIAENWNDPLFLVTIGAEAAFIIGAMFLPKPWKLAIRQLAHDKRVPLPVRLMVAVGSLPIPGPVDEIVLAAAAAVMLIAPSMRAAFFDAIATGRQVALS
jgi:hypothetical protein